MNAYIYAADIYCEPCGQALRDSLTLSGKAPPTPQDEASYDSGDFPKGPYSESGADTPQHCGSCGLFLEAPLTPAGVQYVLDYLAEAIQRGSTTEVEQTWAADLTAYTLDSNQQATLDAYYDQFVFSVL